MSQLSNRQQGGAVTASSLSPSRTRRDGIRSLDMKKPRLPGAIESDCGLTNPMGHVIHRERYFSLGWVVGVDTCGEVGKQNLASDEG